MADNDSSSTDKSSRALEPSGRRSSSSGAESRPSATFDCNPKDRSEIHSGGNRQKKRRLSYSDSSSAATTPLDDLPPTSPFSTHDISGVPYHISTLNQVAKQICTAATEAWNRGFHYKNVTALLLYWEEDDLEVAQEAAALSATFQVVYHYNTETWKIPSVKPDWDIKERLIRFLRANDAQDNLIIFYYAGHAMKNPQPGGAPLWSSRRTQGKTIFSGGILSNFEEAESDTLLLFDCCHAFYPLNRPTGSGRNIIEVIAAVGFGNAALAAEPGVDSFSYHLDEALALAKRRGPFKVADLHMAIMTRLFVDPPNRCIDSENKYIRDECGPVEYKSQRQCPVHYWLSGAQRSITLAPLEREDHSHTEDSTDTEGSTDATGKLPEHFPPAFRSWTNPAEFPQVLMSFRVSREDINVSDWARWFRDAPAEVRGLIKVEALYRSFSNLIILRMPIQVWCLLPQSNAGSFIGFITSDNQGSEFQREVNLQFDNNDDNNDDAQMDIRSTTEGLDEVKNDSKMLACPFPHRDPEKYGVQQGPGAGGRKDRYRACAGPGFKSIQTLKEHLKRVHTPVQCERCYKVFPGPDRALCLSRLSDHRKLAVSCELGDPSLKCGIDEAQWALLDRINDKGTHRVEKWYEIWDLLFPGTKKPRSPCK
ncbi:hypothetical protein QBC47DRAFT_349 [Echria macrotheca]|uniref:C2H2-type domain-containing protein n=1 Tax=Echria macrotheca TaxID=438768 RepID=A0AAJ0FAG4_9PEZI|nr:hypothetical protein QBC47DRAFT_349 [Echria macrotheca]